MEHFQSEEVSSGLSQLGFPWGVPALLDPGPFAGGEQGAGVQVMPDKDPEQAGDHDDHSARGDHPGHGDTYRHRRQHPQHHR